MCSVSSVVLPRVLPDDHPSVSFAFPVRASVGIPAGKSMFAACAFESLTPELSVCGYTTAFALYVNYNFPFLRDEFLPQQSPEEQEWDVTLVVVNLQVTTYLRNARVLTKTDKEFVQHLPGHRTVEVHPANVNFVLSRDEIMRGQVGFEKRVFMVSIRDDAVPKLRQNPHPFQFVLALSNRCWAMLGQAFFVTSMSAEIGVDDDGRGNNCSTPFVDDRLFFESPRCLLSAEDQRRVAAVFKDIYPLDARWYHPHTGRSLLSVPAAFDATECGAEVRVTVSLRAHDPPGFDSVSGFETKTRDLLLFGDEDLNPGNRDVMHLFFLEAEQRNAVPLREVLADFDVFLNGVALTSGAPPPPADAISVPVPRANWFPATVDPSATASLQLCFRRKRGGQTGATLVPHTLFLFSPKSVVLLKDTEGEAVSASGARVLAAASNCSLRLLSLPPPPPPPALPVARASAAAAAPAVVATAKKKNPTTATKRKKKSAVEEEEEHEEVQEPAVVFVPECERARRLCVAQYVFSRNLDEGTAYRAPQLENRVYVSSVVYLEWIKKLASQVPQIMNAELLRRRDKTPVAAPVRALVESFCVAKIREHMILAKFLTEKTFLQISATLVAVICRVALTCGSPEDQLDASRFEVVFFRFLAASEQQLLHPFRIGVMRAVLGCPDIPWVADAKSIATHFFAGVLRGVDATSK